MRVELNGDVYRIRFEYTTKFNVEFVKGRTRVRTCVRTICLIEAISGTEKDGRPRWIPAGTGAVTCSYADQFCKETGRKLAMRNALDGNYEKAERCEFWGEYFARTGHDIGMWEYGRSNARRKQKAETQP